MFLFRVLVMWYSRVLHSIPPQPHYPFLVILNFVTTKHVQSSLHCFGDCSLLAIFTICVYANLRIPSSLLMLLSWTCMTLFWLFKDRHSESKISSRTYSVCAKVLDSVLDTSWKFKFRPDLGYTWSGSGSDPNQHLKFQICIPRSHSFAVKK